MECAKGPHAFRPIASQLDKPAPVEEGIDHQQTVAWAGGDAEADGCGAEDNGGGAEEADAPERVATPGRSPIAPSDPPPPAEDGAKSASKVPSPVFAGVGDGVEGEEKLEEGGKGSSGGSWLEELRAEAQVRASELSTRIAS